MSSPAPPHFVCPACRSTLVRPILVTATTIRLLCDDCDHEWDVKRDKPGDRS